MKHVNVIHITNGAARNGIDAKAAGFSSWQEYAKVRYEESEVALKLTNNSVKYSRLDCADQESSYQMSGIAVQLASLFKKIDPRIVITHPYEGGHPDHDSTALAVWAACQLLKKQNRKAPSIIEFTSYHNGNGAMITGEFLPCENSVVRSVILSEAEMALKRRMLECFTTQKKMVELFSVKMEKFRKAPQYDFTAPPHDGALYYELFNWGMNGRLWRDLAKKTLSALHV